MVLKDRDSRKVLSNHPLRIFLADRSSHVPAARLRKVAIELYADERIPAKRKISLVFCSNEAIHDLNRRYRHIDRPTDVLSFTFSDPDLLGEIYISLPRAREQAEEYKVSLYDEILRLFVHGFFHLLGYDHENVQDRAKMVKKERLYI